MSRVSAEVILAEIGSDMTLFPTAGHLLSWAGLVPRLDESAGKRRSTRVRKGAPWLKPVLVQCAWGAARTKGTYYQAQFFRLKSRRGPKKAAIAVAASLLTAAYHMLKDGTFHQDLGADFLVKRDKARIAARLAKRIKDQAGPRGSDFTPRHLGPAPNWSGMRCQATLRVRLAFLTKVGVAFRPIVL